MNILVSALGAQPDIIEEVVGYVNFWEVDFYKKLASYRSVQESREEADFSSYPIDELWLVATDREHKTIIDKNGKQTEYISTIEDFAQIEKLREVCKTYSFVCSAGCK